MANWLWEPQLVDVPYLISAHTRKQASSLPTSHWYCMKLDGMEEEPRSWLLILCINELYVLGCQTKPILHCDFKLRSSSPPYVVLPLLSIHIEYFPYSLQFLQTPPHISSSILVALIHRLLPVLSVDMQSAATGTTQPRPPRKPREWNKMVLQVFPGEMWVLNSVKCTTGSVTICFHKENRPSSSCWPVQCHHWLQCLLTSSICM